MWLQMINMYERCWLRSKATFRMLVLLKKQLCARLARASVTAMQRRKPVSIQPVSVHMIRHIHACAPAKIACPGFASDC